MRWGRGIGFEQGGGVAPLLRPADGGILERLPIQRVVAEHRVGGAVRRLQAGESVRRAVIGQGHRQTRPGKPPVAVLGEPGRLQPLGLTFLHGIENDTGEGHAVDPAGFEGMARPGVAPLPRVGGWGGRLLPPARRLQPKRQPHGLGVVERVAKGGVGEHGGGFLMNDGCKNANSGLEAGQVGRRIPRATKSG